MFFLQAYGSGFVTLLIPLAVMTTGFGFTNVGATTFALQSASKSSKELSLGISRASTSVGQTLGPLLCGALIEQMGYGAGFQTMALISLGYFFLSSGFESKRNRPEPYPTPAESLVKSRDCQNGERRVFSVC
jgi:MFS family permease